MKMTAHLQDEYHKHMLLFLVCVRVERGRNVVATMYQFTLTSVRGGLYPLTMCDHVHTHTVHLNYTHTPCWWHECISVGILCSTHKHICGVVNFHIWSETTAECWSHTVVNTQLGQDRELNVFLRLYALDRTPQAGVHPCRVSYRILS